MLHLPQRIARGPRRHGAEVLAARLAALLFVTLSLGFIHLPVYAELRETVGSIVEVQLQFLTSEPPGLVVTATGQVPTLGFSSPKLERIVHVVPPSDGYQVYKLTALPPNGPAAPQISTVEASNGWLSFEQEAPWIRGVRILGSGAGIAEHSLDRKVRRNIRSLSADEISTFRLGVEIMKRRPPNDPRSWAFQANIHGAAPGAPRNPLFSQCQHGSIHFLTWHRMYLFHFEAILRDACGDPNFTLPYWDWTEELILPMAFREPSNAANSLFDATREINNGSMLPTSVVRDDLIAAFSQRGFFTFPSGFSSFLEGSPHGAVHMLTGGNMTRFSTAGQDPIFWLHHCNIDRIWDEWLTAQGGRENPSSPSFLNQSFSFVAGNGTTVTRRVGDALYTGQLGYNYDMVPAVRQPTPQILAAAVNEEEEPARPQYKTVASTSAAAPAVAAPSDSRSARSTILGLEPHHAKLTLMPEVSRPASRVAAAGAEPGQVLIQVHGIQWDEAPNFTYAAYLNPPDGVTDERQLAPHRLGTLDLFSVASEHQQDEATTHLPGHGDARGATQIFDATNTISRLRSIGAWDDAADISVLLLPVTAIPPAADAEAHGRRLRQSAEAAKVRYDEITVLVRDH